MTTETPTCPADAASEADRAFFEANPRRQFRIRPAVPGEFGPFESAPLPPGAFRYVAVRQLRPGVRARVSFGLFGTPAATEGAARALFRRAMSPATAAAACSEEVGHA